MTVVRRFIYFVSRCSCPRLCYSHYCQMASITSAADQSVNLASLIPVETFRVAIIEPILNGPVIKSDLVAYECSTVSELEKVFEGFEQTPDARRIYIVERSNSSSTEEQTSSHRSSVKSVLTARLGISDEFFSEHDTQGPIFTSDENRIRPLTLPTSLRPEEIWHLNFFETWDYTDPIQNLQWTCPITERRHWPGDDHSTALCIDTHRQLQFHNWDSRDGCLVIAPRKCSYWSRTRGSGWDGKQYSSYSAIGGADLTNP
jgi:hypothetical protein